MQIILIIIIILVFINIYAYQKAQSFKHQYLTYGANPSIAIPTEIVGVQLLSTVCENVNIFYTNETSDTLILVCPSFNESYNDLYELAKSYAKANYNVAFYQPLAPTTAYKTPTTNDLSLTLAFLNDQLCPHKLIIDGRLLGATTILKCYALLPSNLSGLILESLYPSDAAFIEGLLKLHQVPFRLLVAQYCRQNPTDNYQQYLKLLDSPPTLFIHGCEDRITSFEAFSQLYQMVPSNNKVRLIVQSANHENSRSVKPSTFDAARFDFIKNLK